jgi:hypothetical protein
MLLSYYISQYLNEESLTIGLQFIGVITFSLIFAKIYYSQEAKENIKQN